MAEKNPPKPQQEKRGGWLSRFAPGVRKIVSRRDTPDNLWVKDPDTGEMLYRSDLETSLWVTPGSEDGCLTLGDLATGARSEVGCGPRGMFAFAPVAFLGLSATRMVVSDGEKVALLERTDAEDLAALATWTLPQGMGWRTYLGASPSGEVLAVASDGRLAVLGEQPWAHEPDAGVVQRADE